MRLRISLSIVTTLLLSSSLASASPKEEADKHFAEGLRLYAEKDFGAAAGELELAYDAENKQTTLFAWAQAERLYGNCDKSKDLLSKYIANGANPKQAEAAYKLMEECTPRVVEPEDTTDTNVGTTDQTNGTDTTTTGPGDQTNETDLNLTTSTVDEGKPWYRDWIGITLLSTGAVSAIVSGISYSSALNDEDSAVQPGVSYDEFLQFRSEAETERTTAVIFGVGSGLLLTAGVVYVLTGDKGESQEPENLSVQVNRTGATLSWASNF